MSSNLDSQPAASAPPARSANRAPSATFEEAERALLALPMIAQNPWFVGEYWPENRARFRFMVDDVLAHRAPNAGRRLLDIGCFNGAMCFVFAQLGYEATGTDGEDVGQAAFFATFGGTFFMSNLNELDPLSHLADQSMDVVLLGEVIEHVLNHPVGLMKSIARVLRPGGLLVLSTPNPSNLMNAARMVRGSTYMWGTTDFMDQPKVSSRQELIANPAIHYREYTPAEMQRMLLSSGLTVERTRFMGMGASAGQSPMKRLMKTLPGLKSLWSKRLLAAQQYYVSRRP